MTTTVSLNCPRCTAVLGPTLLPKPRKTTTGFASCDRRCDACGIGFSNGVDATTIYLDPLHNLPPEVHEGALATIGASLNERNRKSKEERFGFSTSEDAVTWTVFSWLARENPAALIHLGERIRLRPSRPPAVHLWGVAVPAAERSTLADRLSRVLNKGLKEASDSHTEPDVILDFGTEGIVIIEVKHRSGNDVQPGKFARKFDRYVQDTDAFADPALATASAHYELTRNWRVGRDLADSAAFRLVNLGPAKLFERRAGEKLATFEASLSREHDRDFIRLPWADFLFDIESATGPLPTWLSGWLSTRGIPA
jgi:hypothetical protein